MTTKSGTGTLERKPRSQELTLGLGGETARAWLQPASDSFFPVGTTIVTVTATDAAGNTIFGTFIVTITPKPFKNGDKRHGGS